MLTSRTSYIRAMEKAAVAGGTSEWTLMLRAGMAAAEYILKKYPDAFPYIVLAGGGNNGGDALVVANCLYSCNRRVVIYSTKEKSAYTGCAAIAVQNLSKNIPFIVAGKLELDYFPSAVIVDGLLGIGFSADLLRDDAASYVDAVNNSHLPVISLDLPSGLYADSGFTAENGAIKACETLTFGRPKPGFFLYNGRHLRGKLRVIDIGLSDDDPEGFDVFTNLDAEKLIPRFPVDCHKNSRGRVAVWAGSPEYPGAAALCSLAALKSGAGLVRVASTADLSSRVCNAVICEKLSPESVPEKILSVSDALVCGCGWGKSAFSAGLKAVLNFKGTVVLDADALNHLAANPELWKKKRKNIILTPHPGEALRLMNGFGITCTSDRRKDAALLADKLGAVVVLKGHDTVVASPEGKAVIVAAGNALLATAGSGDVLAGVIGAMAASGLSPFEAALLGTYLHGIAAESAEKILIADELPELISQVIYKLQHNQII
jgi:NAD(P)H-hydrate epimerase